MKTFKIIASIVVALAAIAGIVYVVATYGDKIVAWAKKLLNKRKNCACCDECECADCECNENGECICDCDCDECECADFEDEDDIDDKDFEA